MTPVREATVPQTQANSLDQLRLALGELFGAERRLRGREQHQPRDLTHSQLRALIALDKAHQATAGDLAKSADLNPASVTAMLDQLEANGIVDRVRDAQDRRVCKVSLTDRGREVVEEARARWHSRWEERFGDLSEDELLVALRALRTMIQLLDEM